MLLRHFFHLRILPFRATFWPSKNMFLLNSEDRDLFHMIVVSSPWQDVLRCGGANQFWIFLKTTADAICYDCRYSMAKKFAHLTAQMKTEKRISRQLEQSSSTTLSITHTTSVSATGVTSTSISSLQRSVFLNPYFSSFSENSLNWIENVNKQEIPLVIWQKIFQFQKVRWNWK